MLHAECVDYWITVLLALTWPSMACARDLTLHVAQVVNHGDNKEAIRSGTVK